MLVWNLIGCIVNMQGEEVTSSNISRYSVAENTSKMEMTSLQKSGTFSIKKAGVVVEDIFSGMCHYNICTLSLSCM
jgi:hypothetical protein